MRLPWFTLFTHAGGQSGFLFLWSEHGIYAWIDAGLGQISIDFYPCRTVHRPSQRLGTFLGPSNIDEAEKTVERHMAVMSGTRLIEGTVERWKQAAE